MSAKRYIRTDNICNLHNVPTKFCAAIWPTLFRCWSGGTLAAVEFGFSVDISAKK